VDLYGGCTILGDGGVILILDPNGLARRTGDVHIEQESHGAARKMTQSFADMPIRFLVFNAGDDTPKAVPLELVARLEEIEATKIEHSSGLSVVQYRDTLMVLIGLQDQNIGEPKEGLYTVVVFNYEGRMVGLVIRNIIDIVDARLELKVSSQDPALIGSMVISGHTTDVIDTGYVISRALGEMKASSDTGENTQQKKRKRTILFVDDSAFFRNLSAPYLSAQGFEVLTADGPPNAFKMLENYPDPVDLIISDIEMPDVNGVEFAKQCQADTRYKDIPMIAYTSTMTTEAIQKGLAAGFKAYVSKTDRDGLVREVGTILS
jgi:two-component system chemotaxis sensor kinase CheA